jgi:hypothetical protein
VLGFAHDLTELQQQNMVNLGLGEIDHVPSSGYVCRDTSSNCSMFRSSRLFLRAARQLQSLAQQGV